MTTPVEAILDRAPEFVETVMSIHDIKRENVARHILNIYKKGVSVFDKFNEVFTKAELEGNEHFDVLAFTMALYFLLAVERTHSNNLADITKAIQDMAPDLANLLHLYLSVAGTVFVNKDLIEKFSEASAQTKS